MRRTSNVVKHTGPIRFRLSKRALCGTEPESLRVVKTPVLRRRRAARSLPYIPEALEQNFFQRIFEDRMFGSATARRACEPRPTVAEEIHPHYVRI
jgi:hypothetical protein